MIRKIILQTDRLFKGPNNKTMLQWDGHLIIKLSKYTKIKLIKALSMEFQPILILIYFKK